MQPLLSIENLKVSYKASDGLVKAVSDVSFSLEKGETLGLVGETGAGKTTTALSIMGLIDSPPGTIEDGKILLDGENLLEKNSRQMRSVRGAKISMIFQDPMTSLNPIITVDEQIAEMVYLHNKVNRKEALIRANEMLETVGIPLERANEYPHQFSGGMKQRVGIAMALACNPALLIADEPTTALDVTIQAQVLELMKGLKSKFDTSMLMITHDLGIVAEICDKVAIMYAGRIIETADTIALYENHAHPYTKGLFNSIPNVQEEREQLLIIPGLPPDPTNMPTGCAFEPRCQESIDECRHSIPPSVQVGPGHYVACFCVKEIADV